MNKHSFIRVLERYELPSENVYEDLSEIGTVLWHNGTLAIKVVCAVESYPCLSLVVLGPNNNYSYFESELEGFSSSDVGRILTYAKEHSDLLRHSAMAADDTLSISIDGQRWSLRKL